MYDKTCSSEDCLAIHQPFPVDKCNTFNIVNSDNLDYIWLTFTYPSKLLFVHKDEIGWLRDFLKEDIPFACYHFEAFGA